MPSTNKSGARLDRAHGDLRRERRFDQAQADPVALQSGEGELVSQKFAIIGFSVDALTTEVFRQQLTEDVKNFAETPVEPKIWDWFLERIHYVQGDFQDSAAFERLKQQLDQVDHDHGTEGNRLYYLAVALDSLGRS